MKIANPVFIYKDNQSVRTIQADYETWFVAKDVCDILEIGNPSDAVKDFDDGEKDVCKILTPNGMQEMIIISIAGVYALIMKRKNPNARRFSWWITHKLIPSICMTDRCSKDNISQNDLECASFIYQSAGITGTQLTIALNNMYKAYSGKDAVETGDIQLTATAKKQLLTPAEIGKHFGISAMRVNEILAGAGYQYKIHGNWEILPHGESYAVMRDIGKIHPKGVTLRQITWDSEILPIIAELLTQAH